jgi:thiol-disulfide isomerase/thioredoxin
VVYPVNDQRLKKLFLLAMRTWIIALFVLISGNAFAQSTWQHVDLMGLDGKARQLCSSKGVKIVVFFAPDCPICQNYVPALNNISAHNKNQNIQMFAVFPGVGLQAGEVKQFKETYHLQAECVLDTKQELAKALGAKATPEVFLFNEYGFLLYRGAIDNRMYALGQKRQVISQYFLQDALKAIQQHKPIIIRNTRAIGCYIETNRVKH